MKPDFGHITDMVKNALGKAGENTIKGAQALNQKLGDTAKGLAKEAEVGPQIHEQAAAALMRMQEQDSSVRPALEKAYGYAVFPSLARASAALGVSYGRGEVFEKGKVIGYAGVVQLTIGGQLGGETVHELVIFDNKEALDRFKAGGVGFAANASAALVKAGAVAQRGPKGMHIFLFSEGGMMLEAAIGAQTFKFVEAGLGRLRRAPEPPESTAPERNPPKEEPRDAEGEAKGESPPEQGGPPQG